VSATFRWHVSRRQEAQSHFCNQHIQGIRSTEVRGQTASAAPSSCFAAFFFRLCLRLGRISGSICASSKNSENTFTTSNTRSNGLPAEAPVVRRADENARFTEQKLRFLFVWEQAVDGRAVLRAGLHQFVLVAAEIERQDLAQKKIMIASCASAPLLFEMSVAEE
jgi:hypothetical protein